MWEQLNKDCLEIFETGLLQSLKSGSKFFIDLIDIIKKPATADL
jgi:hypothetical protein